MHQLFTDGQEAERKSSSDEDPQAFLSQDQGI